MGKVRLSISLSPEQAERIRTHAERAGMDVSAYFVNAATRQMAETEAIEDKFREIDALIDSVEEEGRLLGPPSDEEPDSASLTEEERRRVERAVGLVLGTGEDDPSPGSAAA